MPNINKTETCCDVLYSSVLFTKFSKMNCNSNESKEPIKSIYIVTKACK